jgi:hypothetical protein
MTPNREDRRIVNAMTVDVEDYFHVSAFDRVVSRASWDGLDSRVAVNTYRLLDTFDSQGLRATFFVLGWIAQRHRKLVRDIMARGHEVASHGHHHEDVVAVPVVGFRAPSYSIVASTLWALDILIEEGYLYDTSVFPIHHDRYGIPDAPRHPHRIERPSGTLIEVPASTVRVGRVNLPVAGGGYFRMLPYAWTRWGINRVNTTERAPVVFYLHPWEIDPEQPRIAVGPTTRVRHYSGLGRTAGRLTRLLRDFRFDTIASVLKLEVHPPQARVMRWHAARQVSERVQ